MHFWQMLMALSPMAKLGIMVIMLILIIVVLTAFRRQ